MSIDSLQISIDFSHVRPQKSNFSTQPFKYEQVLKVEELFFKAVFRTACLMDEVIIEVRNDETDMDQEQGTSLANCLIYKREFTFTLVTKDIFFDSIFFSQGSYINMSKSSDREFKIYVPG